MSLPSSVVARPVGVRAYAADPKQVKSARKNHRKRQQRKNPGGYADGVANAMCCMCGAAATLHNLCDTCRAKVYVRARAVLNSRIQNDMKTWVDVLADCESRLPLDDLTALEYFEFSQDSLFVMYLLRKAKETYTASTGNTMALLPKNALLQIVKDIFGADWVQFERQVTQRNKSAAKPGRGRLVRPKRQERVQMSDVQEFLEGQVQQRLARVQTLVADRSRRRGSHLLSLVLVPKQERVTLAASGHTVQRAAANCASSDGVLDPVQIRREDHSKASTASCFLGQHPQPRERGSLVPSPLTNHVPTPSYWPHQQPHDMITFPRRAQRHDVPPLPRGISQPSLLGRQEDSLNRTASLRSRSPETTVNVNGAVPMTQPEGFFKFVPDHHDPLAVNTATPTWDYSPCGSLFDWPSDDAETTRTSSSDTHLPVLTDKVDMAAGHGGDFPLVTRPPDLSCARSRTRGMQFVGGGAAPHAPGTFCESRLGVMARRNADDLQLMPADGS